MPRQPLTATLGLPIYAQSTRAEGTGGFFIAEGREIPIGSSSSPLATFRLHAGQERQQNTSSVRTTAQRCHNVTLFGDAAFRRAPQIYPSPRSKARQLPPSGRRNRIRAVEGKDGPEANREAPSMPRLGLDKAKKVMRDLKTLYQDVSTHWATSESRVLGHVILSPPISVSSSEGLYGGTGPSSRSTPPRSTRAISMAMSSTSAPTSPIVDFIIMMNLTYLDSRLLRLEGTIPDEEMRRPTALDKKRQTRGLLVIKRG